MNEHYTTNEENERCELGLSIKRISEDVGTRAAGLTVRVATDTFSFENGNRSGAAGASSGSGPGTPAGQS